VRKGLPSPSSSDVWRREGTDQFQNLPPSLLGGGGGEKETTPEPFSLYKEKERGRVGLPSSPRLLCKFAQAKSLFITSSYCAGKVPATSPFLFPFLLPSSQHFKWAGRQDGGGEKKRRAKIISPLSPFLCFFKPRKEKGRFALSLSFLVGGWKEVGKKNYLFL